jgi:hypothetical protein
MMKRLIYLGFLLVAISIVSYYAIFSSVSSQAGSALGQNVTRIYDNYSLSGNSINVFGFNSTAGNASIYLERSNSPLEVFLLNGTGYGRWKAAINGSENASGYMALAKRLEGKGALMIYYNVTNATIPVVFSKPVYAQNESNLSLGILGSGRFYVLSAMSPRSEAGNATVKSTLAEGISLYGSSGIAGEFSFAGMAVTITLVAGLILILIGIMKEDAKKHDDDIKPEAVDELYRGIRNSSSAEPDASRHGAKRGKAKKSGRR